MELNEQQKLSVGRWNKKKKKVKIVPYIKLSAEEKAKREELGLLLYKEPIIQERKVFIQTEFDGTKEAFINLLERRGIYKILGVTPPTVSSWRRSLNGKDHRGLSLDKMEEMLLKAGYRVKSEKVWDIKIKNK